MCFFCLAGGAVGASARSPGPAAIGVVPHIVVNFVAPVLFTVLGFNVYSYGVMIALALSLATWNLGRELEKSKIDLDIYYVFFIFLIGFAVGSKSHVAISAFAVGEPITWKALDIRNGHSFMGSAIGGVGSLLVYITWNKVGVLKFLDALLPSIMLGHVIGKGGCFLSGDGCYGPPVDPRDVPWAMSFPNAAEPTRVPVHPTPIYEGVLSLAVFLISMFGLPLPAIGAKGPDTEGPRPGRRTALVLVMYGIERAICEEYRRHPSIKVFGGITEYQALAVVFLFIGIALEAWIRFTAGPPKKKKKSKKKAETAPAEEEEVEEKATKPKAKEAKKSAGEKTEEKQKTQKSKEAKKKQ